MTRRRIFAASIRLAVFSLWTVFPRGVLSAASPSTPAPPPSRFASILDADTLKAGLRTTEVEEGTFIEQVVQLAKKGTVPPYIVISTFQWARKKPNFQFQYFKRGLIVRYPKLPSLLTPTTSSGG